ncbi:ThiF family adenylyltransferase [Marinicrinis sediminis]
MRVRNIGQDGQEKLCSSRIAIVGMGALGCMLAQHLVRSGVGYVRLIDGDTVELSNLQRQLLYDEADAAVCKPKVIAAADKLSCINSQVELSAIFTELHAWNARELLADIDLILDGSDRMDTRLLLNDVSLKLDIPWIYGGVVRDEGMYAVFQPSRTICFRCLFASHGWESHACRTQGVLSPAVAVTSSYQAMEAIKLLTGATDAVTPYAHYFSMWEDFRYRIDLRQDGKEQRMVCKCAQRDHEKVEMEAELIHRGGLAVPELDVRLLCKQGKVQITSLRPLTLNLQELAEQLASKGVIELNRYRLRFRPGSMTVQLTFFFDGRVFMDGLSDLEEARQLYLRYVGQHAGRSESTG